MAEFTVQQGKRYRAEISLRFYERIVSNETIESRLREAGFSEVRVSGSGATRHAEAVWPRPDTTAMMPAQIASIAELPDPDSEAFRA
jgi:hypothetical protein